MVVHSDCLSPPSLVNVSTERLSGSLKFATSLLTSSTVSWPTRLHPRPELEKPYRYRYRGDIVVSVSQNLFLRKGKPKSRLSCQLLRERYPFSRIFLKNFHHCRPCDMIWHGVGNRILLLEKECSPSVHSICGFFSIQIFNYYVV